MWRRLKRMVQANLGRLAPASGAAGALKRQADDIAREMPALDANLATIRAEATVSEEKLRRLHRRDEELVALMAAAQARGAVDRAVEYTTELASVRRDVGEVEAHLARVRAAIEAAGRTKDALRAARERKLEEAREVARNLAELEREDAKLAAPMTTDLDPPPPDAPPEPAARAPAQKTLGPAGPAANTTSEAAPRDPAGKTLGSEAAAPVASAAPSAKTFGPAPATPPPAQAAPAVAPAAAARPLEIKVRAVARGAAEPVARAESTPAAAQEAASGDLVSELERLGRLRAAGALTDDELALAKKKLLGGASPRGAS